MAIGQSKELIMSVLCNTVIGENRGTPRIWLEGAKLIKGGFEPGAYYERT